ncbi:STAS domain-containing protein [Streptomyces sp. NPDC049915]|uniref:STAS domain-containing protein n=1 Tax=Streptomyces sp. NPDC049915 TaxID=3155510 RepID=UPI00342C5FB0
MLRDEAVGPTLMSDSGGTPLPEQATGRASQEAGVLQYEWRGAWVIAARGAYDMESITPLAEALEAAAKEHSRVVLEASGVTFADSTFLNLLILAHRTGTLRLVAPSAPVRRVCEITGVDNLLEIRDTLDDAVVS